MARRTEDPPEKQKGKKAVLRVAVYCRVSTEHEEQESSLHLQEEAYRQMIEATDGWENVGIYTEHASGLYTGARDGFLQMMQDCRKKKIDLILTKSVSRFGRNTLDMLKALRELRELDIDVYFEKEQLWLHDQKMEILLTMYCAFAQHESESMSRNIRLGIRYGFETGTSGYANFTCYGYRSNDDGELTIYEHEAAIVRTIFTLRAENKSLGYISERLHENKIPSPTGCERWSRETISKLLKNEKYTGDVLLQKTFVEELFSGKQVKNVGQEQRYLICDHQPAIISRELFAKISPEIAKTLYGTK